MSEQASTEAPAEWSVWPPPQTSRSHRRACAKDKHHGMIKAGYCALCGTKVGE